MGERFISAPSLSTLRFDLDSEVIFLILPDLSLVLTAWELELDETLEVE